MSAGSWSSVAGSVLGRCVPQNSQHALPKRDGADHDRDQGRDFGQVRHNHVEVDVHRERLRSKLTTCSCWPGLDCIRVVPNVVTCPMHFNVCSPAHRVLARSLERGTSRRTLGRIRPQRRSAARSAPRHLTTSEPEPTGQRTRPAPQSSTSQGVGRAWPSRSRLGLTPATRRPRTEARTQLRPHYQAFTAA